MWLEQHLNRPMDGKTMATERMLLVFPHCRQDKEAFFLSIIPKECMLIFGVQMKAFMNLESMCICSSIIRKYLSIAK